MPHFTLAHSQRRPWRHGPQRYIMQASTSTKCPLFSWKTPSKHQPNLEPKPTKKKHTIHCTLRFPPSSYISLAHDTRHTTSITTIPPTQQVIRPGKKSLPQTLHLTFDIFVSSCNSDGDRLMQILQLRFIYCTTRDTPPPHPPSR